MTRVYASTVLDAPIERVWQILRDFNGHDRWHPAITTSRIEAGTSDAVGAVRRFRLADGSELREQLLELSDATHEFRYCLLSSPLPLMGYVARVRLRPVTDGNRTLWEWSSEFTPPPYREAELIALVREGIYRAGFEALRQSLHGGTPPKATPTLLPQSTSSKTTRAIVVAEYGGPEVMQLRDVPLQDPGPGQVQIRHTAIGVNFIDVYCRSGMFSLLQPPGTPGMEAAGVIEAIGAGVTEVAVGDRVAYACPPVGSYAERRIMSPELMVHLREDVSDQTAASSLLKGISASFLLHDIARLQPGMSVLIHAAAGGIGQILVQWAKALGCEVFATSSTPDKLRLIKSLGADHVIDYVREDFPTVTKDLTGKRGVDVVFDSAGKSTFAGSLEALGLRGHLISFGQASGPVGSWEIDRFASKSLTISRPNYAHYTDTPERLAPHVGRFFAAVRTGAVKLQVATVYPLAQAGRAHHDLESRATTGALVLMP
jgi:NADPH:quinone reductase-like Zn-dependent oxidoreductase